MSSDMLMGTFALIFGLTTLVGRVVAPDSKMFSKLGPTKERFGDKAGTTLHVVAYKVMPLAAGAMLLAPTLIAAGS